MAELTGRKVFAIAVAFFGTITTVNLVMAYNAVATFPGLETQNAYIAAQNFDARREAQDALGWSVQPEYHDGELRLQITDAQGLPAALSELKVLVGRATLAADDQRPEFNREAGVFVAPATLDEGKWMLQIEAQAPDGTPFRQRLDFYVEG